MEYREGRTGRVFLLRFEHGEDVLAGLREVAFKENVQLALVNLIGAFSEADIVTGPKEKTLPPDPDNRSMDDGRETVACGIMICDGNKARLHMHGALGREEKACVGCIRKNARAFVTIEAVLTEIRDVDVVRRKDVKTGCDLMLFL